MAPKGTGRARQGDQSVHHNGVAEVLYSDQHLVHIVTNYLKVRRLEIQISIITKVLDNKLVVVEAITI